ncbi:MAG TPA: inositol monophosphatase family protein [Acidimicrobiales bacterium]|nr:inositol monophosphatase family protein [Acidimicrobiales bacterium]
MAPDEVDALRDLAREVAVAAGELLLTARAGGDGLGRLATDATRKSSRTDLATDADRASEELVRAMLGRARPHDAMLGEEGGSRPGTSGLTWVVDPLDGTTNYVYDFPLWSVSVAVVDRAGPLAGAVHQPLSGETFSAARGRGASLDGRELVARRAPPLADALVGTGFSYDAGVRAAQAALLTTVLPAVRDIRRGGSAAIDLCWLAAGRLDAFYEAGLKPWDRAAGLLVAHEAGIASLELDGVVPAGATLVAAAPDLLAGLAALLARAAPAR